MLPTGTQIQFQREKQRRWRKNKEAKSSPSILNTSKLKCDRRDISVIILNTVQFLPLQSIFNKAQKYQLSYFGFIIVWLIQATN